MAYVPVPKDLSKIKTKVAFNLTKRQIICFAAALAMGLPLFFLLKDSAGTSMAAFAMIVVMLTARYVDVRLERKKEVLDAYHGAVKQADPAKAKEAEPKKAKSAAKKKSSEIEL